MNDAIISKIADYFHQESWLIQVFIVVFITLLIDFIQKRAVDRVYGQCQRTDSYWDDAFVDAIRRPLRVVIWIIGISYAISIVQAEKAAAIFAAVSPLRDVGVIAAIAWFLGRFITRCEASYLKHKSAVDEEIDQTTADAIAQLLRLSVIITAALVGLQTLGFKVSGVLAFGGVGGIAIGFAAKDLLANFFGGLMLHLDRPFRVGDWVRSPDRNIEGTVEKIGWRLTVMRTFDKRPLYVPNALFTQIVVENPSRMTNRRIVETVGIRYDDAGQMAGVVADVKAMLEAHPEIDTDQTLIVNFNEFSPSSLDFFVYTYTKTTQWVRFHEIKQDVLLKIIEIIEDHGAQCAFPTSTIHLAGPDGPETSISAAG
ncbi:MAG: mechanosensitive ion channel family protein [Gammaproteobacteria bacterium]|nr:mechanosensitive ion channel family protein [Gammaproteobacteria bacterium]